MNSTSRLALCTSRAFVLFQLDVRPAHYGMKHGPGKVDWTTVEKVQVGSKKKKKPAGTTCGYRTGNWTQEEHDAFLRGHAKYGNRQVQD